MRDAKTSENERKENPKVAISKQLRMSRESQSFQFWDFASIPRLTPSRRTIKHDSIIDPRKAATADVGKIRDDDLNWKSADSNPIPVSDNLVKFPFIMTP